MLEILKSKVMMLTAIILLGVVFMGAGISNKLEENETESYDKVIAMNIQ